MSYVRKLVRGDLIYYDLVESYRDKQGRPRTRVLKWLGKSKTPAPEPVQVSGVHFGVLAFKMMDGSLTPQDVFDLLDQIGKKPTPLPTLEAVGVRFDFFDQTLQVWLYPKDSTSRRRARAPRAGAGGASRKRGPARDS